MLERNLDKCYSDAIYTNPCVNLGFSLSSNVLDILLMKYIDFYALPKEVKTYLKLTTNNK